MSPDQPQEASPLAQPAITGSSISPEGQNAGEAPKRPGPPKMAPGERYRVDTGGLTLEQARRIFQWGAMHRKRLKSAWEGKASPRTAIKLQCLECCGEDKAAIGGCGDRCCPLWRYRPYQQGEEETEEEEV